MFIIAQIIGLFALIALVLSFQKNDKKTLLKFQIVSSFLYSIQYLLLNAFSGCFMNIACALRNIVFSHYDKKIPKIYLILTIITMTILSALSYKTPISILPGIACIIYSISLSQPNLKITRITHIISCTLYIIYNIKVVAITGLICTIVELSSSIIAILKYDLPKLKK